MEIFSHPIVAVVLLLGVLVIVHEAGHYIVGRLCGIAVEAFSIGFGPVILQFRKGETEYRISAIPLGGYVKFYGSLPEEPVPEAAVGREYFRASPWKRILVIFAGPAANFLLAIASYAWMVGVGIPQPPPVIGEIMVGSPAERSGLAFLDRITEINGTPIETWADVQRNITVSPGSAIDLSIVRDGQPMRLQIVPDAVSDDEVAGLRKKGQIGITPNILPSIVQVLDGNNMARQHGFETGDEITSAQVPGAAVVNVKYWRQFETMLVDAEKNGAVELEINVKRAEKPVALKLPILKNEAKNASVYASTLGLTHAQFTVEKVEDEALAKVLLPKDRIIAFKGTPINDVFQMRDLMLANDRPIVSLEVQRDNQRLTLEAPLKGVEIQKPEGKATLYSLPVQFVGSFIEPEMMIEKESNFFGAIAWGMRETSQKSKSILIALGGLVTGKMPVQSLGGLISIAKVASDSAKMGWLAFMSTLAIVSVNLGLLNLIPIPVLDGGQLVLVSAEIIKRKPLTQDTIENYQRVGFVLVLALIVVATYNDVSRFWTSMLASLSGWFQ